MFSMKFKCNEYSVFLLNWIWFALYEYNVFYFPRLNETYADCNKLQGIIIILLYYNEFEVFGLLEVLVLFSPYWWETPESSERRLIRWLTDFECGITNYSFSGRCTFPERTTRVTPVQLNVIRDLCEILKSRKNTQTGKLNNNNEIPMYILLLLYGFRLHKFIAHVFFFFFCILLFSCFIKKNSKSPICLPMLFAQIIIYC